MTSWPRALQPWSPWPAAYVACGNTFRTKPSESLFAPLFSLLPGNWKSVEARDVAQVMLQEALGASPGGVNIITSAKIREMAQGQG